MKVESVVTFLNGLATTRRYSNSRLIQDENLAEHTGSIVVMCRLFHGAILEVQPDLPIDLGELMAKAALHDVEEVITGDVPRPSKYYSPETRQAFEAVECAGAEQLFSSLGISDNLKAEFYDEWLNAKEGLTGTIIKIADLLAVVYKLHSEVTMMGNLSMLTSCNNMVEYLLEMRDGIKPKYDQYPAAWSKIESLIDQAIVLARQSISRGEGVVL